MTFRAVWLEQAGGETRASVADVAEADLPEGEVTVRVRYSSLNYKDALAITGAGPVVRGFPMVPGIDLAGEVMASESTEWSVGDQVLLNGWGVGESHWGGMAQRARVQADWLLPIPDPFTAYHAMAIGTAGYTAALCVEALLHHGLAPEDGPVAVTGANGGVGHIAIALLARAGFEVEAVTGRPGEAAHLLSLGASSVVPREELTGKGRPLAKARWAGAVDTVGSEVLANLLASMRYGGVVAACGLAGGMDLPATVAPFILRGVTLAGIDSVYAPRQARERAWQRLARDLEPQWLESVVREISLDGAIDAADDLLAGRVRGRLVVATGG